MALAYAPEYSLKINGNELPAALRGSITSVNYQDGVNAADRVEIGIANPDLRWVQEHIRGLGMAPFPTGLKVGALGIANPGPDGAFDIDNKVSLALGYAPDPLHEVFKGEVTGVQVTFPSAGVPGVTLIAHDYLHRLTQGTAARGFGPLADALVAIILSAENLLIPLIDPAVMAVSTALTALNVIFSGTGTKQGAPEKGESDFDLLKRIADRYDADFWVEGDVLYLARFIPKEYSPRLTLTYGESLIEFSPQMSTVGQVAAVSMKFTLRELRLNFLVTVGWDFDREALKVVVIPGEAEKGAKAVSGPSYKIIDRPITSPADIATSALSILSELRATLNKRVTGSGSAIGNPAIRAGAMIELTGLGPDFSGNYRVSSATHTIDSSGYLTRFDVYKEFIP